MLRNVINNCINDRSCRILFSRPSYYSVSLMVKRFRRVGNMKPTASVVRQSVLDTQLSPSRRSETALKEAFSVLSIPEPDHVNALESVTTMDEMLQYLRQNNDLHDLLLSAVYTKIRDILQSGKSTLTKEELIKTEEIENLSRKMKKSCRYLKPPELINVLSVLSYLGVSTNSLLSQHILQMLTKYVNEFSLGQISFLSFLLRNSDSSPISEALKISLPIVFDTNVRVRLEYENVDALETALTYASFNTTSEESIDIIIRALLEVKDKFTCFHAVRIVSALQRKRKFLLLKDRKYLFDICLSLISSEMGTLSVHNVISLHQSLTNSFLFKSVMFYNEKFMKEVERYAVEKQLDLQTAGQILKTFNKISYRCTFLIDYISLKLADVADFQTVDLQLVQYLITACSNCVYTPESWLCFEDKLIEYIESITRTDIPLIRTTLELASLQCWSKKLNETVFNEKYVREYLNKEYNLVDHLVILNLYQAVKTLFPGGYDSVWPPTDVLKKATEFECDKHESVLQSSLEAIYKGKQYILPNLTTGLGHFIDHLVVLRKDGTPFPILDNIDHKPGAFLESYEYPTDSFLFAILPLNAACYCIDGIHLRGRVKLYLDSLNALGVIVVPISQVAWLNLRDIEKLPFLKREIDTRIPVDHMKRTLNRTFAIDE